MPQSQFTCCNITISCAHSLFLAGVQRVNALTGNQFVPVDTNIPAECFIQEPKPLRLSKTLALNSPPFGTF